MNRTLPARHLLLAIAVVAVWGTNFVVMKAALGHVPPLLFATLRFVFALVPGLLFLPHPQTPWPSMAAYGLLTGAQFGLVYVAVNDFDKRTATVTFDAGEATTGALVKATTDVGFPSMARK